MRRVRCPQSRDSSTAWKSASEPLTQPGTRSIQLCGSSQARVSRRKPGSKEGSAESKAKKACTCSNVTAWKRKGGPSRWCPQEKGGPSKWCPRREMVPLSNTTAAAQHEKGAAAGPDYAEHVARA